MRFCPKCENFLIPRNKSLFCRVCEKEFELDPKVDDYIVVKTIKHDDKESAPIVIKESTKFDKISAQDRKAYEDFFQTN